MPDTTNLRLYRKRFIPDEIVELKDDKIVSFDNNILITKWHVLKPRKDIDHGVSAYFIEEGFKISKEFDAENNLVYWYCDIIDTEFNETENAYVFTDLLADVLVYPDNFVKVVDLDEVAEALDNHITDTKMLSKALRITAKLLEIIYSGNFSKYTAYVDEVL
ncbi:MAG: DUF402 domain-containing protein [Lachnospiraceae bacterium]|nr:DUF402 domain-containing protein [Lachnospiraceae bacterium]